MTAQSTAFHLPGGHRLREALVRLVKLYLIHQQRAAHHPAVSRYFYRALEEDAVLVHEGMGAYLMRELDSYDFRVMSRGALRTRGAVRLHGHPGNDRPIDPVLLDLLEEALYHMLRAGNLSEAWNLWRVWIDRPAPLADAARGCRITAIVLRYGAGAAGVPSPDMEEARAQHARFQAALERGAGPRSNRR